MELRTKINTVFIIIMSHFLQYTTCILYNCMLMFIERYTITEIIIVCLLVESYG